MNKRVTLKPHSRQVRASTTKSAKAKTKSKSGRGTQAPGTKLIYNGTLH